LAWLCFFFFALPVLCVVVALFVFDFAFFVTGSAVRTFLMLVLSSFGLRSSVVSLACVWCLLIGVSFRFRAFLSFLVVLFFLSPERVLLCRFDFFRFGISVPFVYVVFHFVVFPCCCSRLGLGGCSWLLGLFLAPRRVRFLSCSCFVFSWCGFLFLQFSCFVSFRSFDLAFSL